MSGVRLSKLSKKAIVTISIIGVVFVGILSTWIIVSVLNNAKNNNSHQAIVTPEYPTSLPKDKSIEELGGWSRVSPSESTPVYAYADTLDGISISVSEQQLPDSFKNDLANQVAELAKKFNARGEIAIGDNLAYIGTSAKGPQSVIFTKDNLLILIKSQKNIETASWAAYIGSLQ